MESKSKQEIRRALDVDHCALSFTTEDAESVFDFENVSEQLSSIGWKSPPLSVEFKPRQQRVVVPRRPRTVEESVATRQRFPDEYRPLTKATQGMLPPDPEKVQEIHVYPDSLLWSLTKELKWVDFPTDQTLLVFQMSDDGEPTDFFVQTYEMISKAKAISKKIQEYLQTAGLQRVINTYAGKVCMAPFDSKYYRAEVLNFSAGTRRQVAVFFSDHGNIAVVDGADLLEMPDEFFEEPRQVALARWDMALTQELSDERIRTVFADRSQKMEARQKICDGQYLVKMESYTPWAKFIAHSLPHPKDNNALYLDKFQFRKQNEDAKQQNVSAGPSSKLTENVPKIIKPSTAESRTATTSELGRHVRPPPGIKPTNLTGIGQYIFKTTKVEPLQVESAPVSVVQQPTRPPPGTKPTNLTGIGQYIFKSSNVESLNQ